MDEHIFFWRLWRKENDTSRNGFFTVDLCEVVRVRGEPHTS
jgi:hypothetical protein